MKLHEIECLCSVVSFQYLRSQFPSNHTDAHLRTQKLRVAVQHLLYTCKCQHIHGFSSILRKMGCPSLAPVPSGTPDQQRSVQYCSQSGWRHVSFIAEGIICRSLTCIVSDESLVPGLTIHIASVMSLRMELSCSHLDVCL